MMGALSYPLRSPPISAASIVVSCLKQPYPETSGSQKLRVTESLLCIMISGRGEPRLTFNSQRWLNPSEQVESFNHCSCVPLAGFSNLSRVSEDGVPRSSLDYCEFQQ